MSYQIQDWEHNQNLKERERLESVGYSFQISSNGYRVDYKGKFLQGAGVQLPRRSGARRTLKHKMADYRDYTRSAITAAQKHEAQN